MNTIYRMTRSELIGNGWNGRRWRNAMCGSPRLVCCQPPDMTCHILPPPSPTFVKICCQSTFNICATRLIISCLRISAIQMFPELAPAVLAQRRHCHLYRGLRTRRFDWLEWFDSNVRPSMTFNNCVFVTIPLVLSFEIFLQWQKIINLKWIGIGDSIHNVCDVLHWKLYFLKVSQRLCLLITLF